MTVIPINEVTRLTLTERDDGLVRLGIEHAEEDFAGNLQWEDPSGSWAHLTQEDVDRLRSHLADVVASRRLRQAIGLLREEAGS